MKEVPGFMLYHDQFAPFVEHLSNAELGELIRAVYTYSTTGEVVPCSDNLKILLSILKTSVDHDHASYRTRCERNSKNAKGRRTAQPETNQADNIISLAQEDEHLKKMLASM